MSRIAPLVDELAGIESADDIMQEVLGVLSEGGAPESGNIYVFVYKPKTPNIRYDEHPLVAVTSVYSWGFKGINFHWGEARQYTWSEVAGGLYQVNSDELNDLDAIPFAKYRLNN